MERLRDEDLRACLTICQDRATQAQACRSVCARAAAVNAIERGKFFNVPLAPPPINDLDTGLVDEVAWQALGSQAFARRPFPAAQIARSSASLSFGGGGAPPVVASAPDRYAGDGALSGAFFGWGQPYDALFQPQFAPPADQQFARAIDLNQAMSGYWVNPPPVQRYHDGATLSWLKATSANGAAELPQGNPFAGQGFNLSQNVPQATVANVLSQPVLFQRARGYSARAQRLANLSS